MFAAVVYEDIWRFQVELCILVHYTGMGDAETANTCELSDDTQFMSEYINAYHVVHRDGAECSI